MERYAILLRYNGSPYHGWQVQPNAVTVQAILENAFSTILGEAISITGAGRTDTGVHASWYVAHFECMNNIHPDKLKYKLNRFLEKDVSIIEILQVSMEFHARFSAESRTYRYVISRDKNPFTNELSYRYTGPLDIGEMNNAAKYLLNVDDFTSFAKLHSDNKTNICKISHSEWKEYRNYLVFTITADRFLRNMVRAITGTLLDIGKGNISQDQFMEITEVRDNRRAGMSAPSKGLYLTNISYPEKFGIMNSLKDEILPFL